tara:strand:- start:6487 stop:7332 length:846 start_codon:yes stop_codon:yes gene_type:complete
MIYFTYIQSDNGRSGHFLQNIFSVFGFSHLFNGFPIYHESWKNQEIISINTFKKVTYELPENIFKHEITYIKDAWNGINNEQYEKIKTDIINKENKYKNVFIILKNIIIIRPDVILNLNLKNNFIIYNNFKETIHKIGLIEYGEFNNNNNIIIHIRRGDLTDRLIKNGFTSKYYKNIVNKLINNHNIIIICENINSNDIKNEFLHFNNNKLQILYGNDNNIKEHFSLMLNSDILIPSSSSFSIIASEMRKNSIYFDTKILNFRPNLLTYKTYPTNYHFNMF